MMGWGCLFIIIVLLATPMTSYTMVAATVASRFPNNIDNVGRYYDKK
jgi:hypothetical protein